MQQTERLGSASHPSEGASHFREPSGVGVRDSRRLVSSRAPMTALFSIGYATKPLSVFLQQLQAHGVTAVADVRSVPYSKRFHDYHREALAESLRAYSIHYVYLGQELGPRSQDPDHYDPEGQVQFERLQGSKPFQAGIARLRRGLDKGLHIALLCAEKDPATCHRSLLVGDYLQSECGLETAHILHDGSLEPQPALHCRLMEINGIAPDLVTTQSQCLALAWQAQCRRCAYRKPAQH